MFIAPLFTIAMELIQPKCTLLDEWIRKIGTNIKCNINKENEIMKFASK